MAGSGLTAGQSKRVWQLISKILGYAGMSGPQKSRKILQIDTAPTNDLASNAPDFVGQFLLDTANDDVYICTELVSTTNFTWTKINA